MCFGKIEAFLYSHPLCPQKLSHPYGSRCREMQTLIGRPAIKGVHSEQQATDRHRLSHWGLRAGRPSQPDSCKGFPQRQHEKRRWLKGGKLLPKPRREQEGQGTWKRCRRPRGERVSHLHRDPPFGNLSGNLHGSSLPRGPNSPTSSPMARLRRSWKG